MELNYFEKAFLNHEAFLQRQDISGMNMAKYELCSSNTFDSLIRSIGLISLYFKNRKSKVSA